MPPLAYANFIFRRCDLDMDHASYLRFLISRHDKLDLSYAFAVKLSFVAGPLLFGKALLIHHEDSYRKLGAVGYTYGTGPDEYKDRENCQLEVFYIEPACRTPDLLLAAASELIDCIREGEAAVRYIQFWTPAAPEGRLLRRIAGLPGASRAEAGALALYRLPLDELERWIAGLATRRARRRTK
ncbi:hypothetical protein [Cohnella sp. 56]|uniref:hypothetical protein n=1 Tax=Cohnella sp. 56 TaxID=3113722 RepID=UPI0030E80A51